MTLRDELDTALVDVRKAYRLVYLYQRRVLDLCDEIKKSFSKNLDFYYWTPSACVAAPRRAEYPPSVRDAWTFLPLYDVCVFYKLNGVHWEELKAGDWMLTVRVSADSGNPDPHPSDPDPRRFEDVTSCESSVRLYVYCCSQPLHANWYSDIFEANLWPRDDGEGRFDRGIRTFGRKFSLSMMANAEGVSQCVEQFSRDVNAALPMKLDGGTVKSVR